MPPIHEIKDQSSKISMFLSQGVKDLMTTAKNASERVQHKVRETKFEEVKERFTQVTDKVSANISHSVSYLRGGD